MPRQNQAGIFDLLAFAREAGELLPLLSFCQRFLGETDPHRRAIVVGDLAEWAASKTPTKLDDKYVAHLRAFLVTDSGEAFVRDLAADIEAMTTTQEPKS